MAKEYCINNEDVSSLTITDDKHSPVTYSGYFTKDPNGTICMMGIGSTPNNPWEILDQPIPYYLVNDKLQTFVTASSCPRFSTNLFGTCTEPGTYKLKINTSGNLVLDKPSGGSVTKKPNDFRTGKIPDRLILILQGAGGGGGGTSIICVLGWCTGGVDGAAGGSGACAGLILNIAKLKESTDNYYTIVIGTGGAGAENCTATGAVVFGNGAFLGTAGQQGGDSYLAFKNDKLFVAGGGKAGKAPASGGKMGSSGTGGECAEVAGLGTYWWHIPCTNGTTYYSQCCLTGATGGGYKKAGGGTGLYAIRATSDSRYYDKEEMNTNIGGCSGGAAGGGYSPGGGASYFAPGGAGGGTHEQGKNGSKGSGGGGGRFSTVVISGNFVGALACIRGGGDGGNGCFEIWF